MFFSKKSDERLNGLLGFTGISTVLVSTAMQSVGCAGFRFAYDNNKHALYIELQDGRRFYFNEIWKFIKAVLFEQRAKNNSGGQSSVGNEIREGQISVGDDVLKNVKSIKNIQNSTVGSEIKEKQVPVGNAEKVVNPELEEERKKLEEDRAFLRSQKDDKEYEKYMKESHKGETDLIREFHFDVMCVLASRVISLRYEEISKKIDDLRKEVSNKFAYIGDISLFLNHTKMLLLDACKKNGVEINEDCNYTKKLRDILDGKSGDLSEFKDCFKDDKEFETFKQKVEFCCSDRFKELYELEKDKKRYDDNLMCGGEKKGGYSFVKGVNKEDVENALKKLPDYKKKYSDLVDENSKKSEFYVRYIPEFFKLKDDATPDEILDCYIKWWIGQHTFEICNVGSSDNKEKERRKGSYVIVYIFYRCEGRSTIAHRTAIKAKENADFLKEYAEKEKILEEREKALELKEKQYEKEGLVAAPIQESSENVG